MILSSTCQEEEAYYSNLPYHIARVFHLIMLEAYF